MNPVQANLANLCQADDSEALKHAELHYTHCLLFYIVTLLEDSSLSLKKGSKREVMLRRQEEIKPLGQPGQYVIFPSTSLLVPFFNDNELSLSPTKVEKRRRCITVCKATMCHVNTDAISNLSSIPF